jgi:hypothetical protein
MAGLVPAIHAFHAGQDVDARHKAGHDENLELSTNAEFYGAGIASRLEMLLPRMS